MPLIYSEQASRERQRIWTLDLKLRHILYVLYVGILNEAPSETFLAISLK